MNDDVKIIPAVAKMSRGLKRVAAYARVSSGKDAMHHSLANQVSYYSELIQSHTGWVYAGVYADEAKTGTKDTRENFCRLLRDCNDGKIDMVITKSISRFARNTVTLLETVRHLKDIGIGVYFEEQRIDTLANEGEMMISLLASIAQEESLSVSENMKWRIRKNFEEGKAWNSNMLGYHQVDGVLQIVPKEAEIVKRIFREYLDGYGPVSIANRLNNDGIKSPKNCQWHQGTIWKILRNEAYTGSITLQRYYSENHITKRKMANDGEKPMYIVHDSHEAIIDEETFLSVQDEIVRRAERFSHSSGGSYPYSGLITCDKCGKHYRRKLTATGYVWICSTFNTKGKSACPSKQIPESTLNTLLSQFQLDEIQDITACDNNILNIEFIDGSTEKLQWRDRSRSESWTPEMKAEARRKLKERCESIA